jgi:sulfur dioxygenase
MLFRQLFDPETSTYTYLLADEETREAVLIDPVLEQVARDTKLLDELGLKLKYVLETHVHADHVTGGGTLRERLGAKTVVSSQGGAPCADVPVDDGDTVRFGKHALEVRSTPGHTNGCVTYVTADKVDGRRFAFTGDALLIRGCGRTDFQQGDSRKLYRSVHDKIFSLEDDTALWVGHDYQGRTVTTVREEKLFNPRLGGGKTEDEFVQLMADLKLQRPKKIDIAVPANLQCGLPERQDAPVLTEAPKRPWAPISRSATGIPEVTPAWVQETFAAGGYRIIDVREPDELRSELGAIEGAENHPLAGVVQALAAWPRDVPLVVVCRSGGRSGRAALELAAQGFNKVASMQGGMLAWAGPRMRAA